MAASNSVINEDPVYKWLKQGQIEKLEHAVLDGYGQHLSGRISPLPQVNRFLKQVPNIQMKIEDIHRSIALGNYRSAHNLIDREKYAFCRDSMGATPLHKAVIYGRRDIVADLLDRFGTTIHTRDHRGRTALHYAAVLADGADVYKRLVDSGADQMATDMYSKKPTDYLQSQPEISALVLRNGAIMPSKARKSRKQSTRTIDSTSLQFHPSRSLMHRNNIKELIRQGNLSTLEEVVLQGFGDRLIGQTANAPLVQEFIDKLPEFIDQITELHRTAMKGNLREFQGLLDRNSMITARDQIGATPLHKAVLYGHMDLAEYIATNFPATLDARDNDGRTALHYASGLDDDRSFYNMLVKAGASPLLPDFKGQSAEFYLRFPDQINLQQIVKRSQRLNANYAINTANRIKSKSSSRRKERSLSPSYRLKRGSDGNGLTSGKASIDGQSEEGLSDRADTSSTEGSHVSSNHGFNYKRKSGFPSASVARIDASSANLKRWIQENNLEMLEGVVLEGHGNRLKDKAEYFTDEESVDSKAYISETLPKMMNKIRVIHAAVSCGDLIGLQDNLDNNDDYIQAKDHLGMAPLHKATIMGHMDVIEYILDKFPEIVNSRDKEGRTALHYSAATTNRNGSKIYKMLIRAGADPRIRDSSGKTADYYRVHLLSLPNELSRVNNKKRLNPVSNTDSQQNVKRRPLILPVIQDRIAGALNDGDVRQLHELVLEGYGDALFCRTSWGEDARKFLKGLPHLMDQINTMHASVTNGDISKVERILSDNSSLIRARDEKGLQPIHIATAHNRPEIVNYFILKYPQSIHFKDISGRTALHISAQNKTLDIYRKLVESGGDPKIMAKNGKTADHYLRVNTIQNYDFVSPLNGKQLNDVNENENHFKINTNNNNLNNNLIYAKKDTTFVSRNKSKSRIKPVVPSKPISNDDIESVNDFAVDSSDGNTSEVSCDHLSTAPVPNNRLPALDLDERDDTQNDIPTEKTDNCDKSNDTNELMAGADSDERETEESVAEDKEYLRDEDNKSSENINNTNEQQMNENVVNDCEQVVDEKEVEPRSDGQHIGHENETKLGIESENILNNDEKSVDIISGNEVSTEVNEDSRGLNACSEDMEPNESADTTVKAHEINVTTIIDNNREDNEREESDEQNAKQSDQMLNIIQTSETTDNKVDINSENVCDSGQQNSSENDTENIKHSQIQANNDIPNEESIARMAESVVLGEKEEGEKRTVGFEPQTDNEVNANETNYAINETNRQNNDKNDSTPVSQSPKSSVSSNTSIQTTRRITRTDSQKSIDSVNKLGKRRSSNAGSRSGKQSSLLKKSSSDNLTKNSGLKQSSKSPQIHENDSVDTMADNVVDESLNAIKSNQSIGEEVEQSNGNADKQIDSTGSESEIGAEKSCVGKSAEVVKTNDNEIQEKHLSQTVEKIETKDENIFTDGQHMSDNEVVGGTDSKLNAENEDIVTATADVDAINELPIDETVVVDDREDTTEDVMDFNTCDKNINDENNGKSDDKNDIKDVNNDDTKSQTMDRESNKEDNAEEAKSDTSARQDMDSRNSESTISTVNPLTDDPLNDLIDLWIQEGDYLRLEHVVIAGQGVRLVGRTSPKEKVQAFLDLVPTYMAKIRTVHEAVVRGNIHEVKQVLTRKRFAMSRDKFGASPLHLAVLHGHLNIMMHIINQYSETANGPDNEGRTPLHFSAVIIDEKKQFYKILCKAGADPSIKDKSGRNSEYYLQNPGVLTIQQLLENYMPSGEHRENGVEVWRRPPTADIESRLTPTPDESDSSLPSPITNHKHAVDAEVHVDGVRSRHPKIKSYHRSLSESSITSTGDDQDDQDQDQGEDEDFETMSNEFQKSLKEEKVRLQRSFDRQMSTPDAIAMSESVVDNIQEAQPPVHSGTVIMNGQNSSGYDLTEIKDENGQTVLHLLAAKPHQRSVFYKMLSQAEYLIPERDGNYRTIRDITVENGIKDNLQVIDQYILDTFTKENKEFVRALALEGYNNLLTVVDSEGHDVIATLNRNYQISMMEMVKDLAQFQKYREELHTFIRHGYAEGVATLAEMNQDLVVAKSERGRHALHISVLFANMDIINTLIQSNACAVNTPDNMGRTPLHYAMASSLMEDIGRVLIRAGANRALRDVRMRTPSYYYVYKQDIRDIKREEQNLTL